MYEMIGDILTPVKAGKPTLVCHQVNCKGVMGAGLAWQIRSRFPNVYDAYHLLCRSVVASGRKTSDMLGSVQYISAEEEAGYTVANLFAQDGFGTGKRQTDYCALRKALADIADRCPQYTVRIPYGMGCGLAGGDWGVVSNIIMQELECKVHRLEIWKK